MATTHPWSIAIKQHECIECGDAIQIGDEFRTCLHDGEVAYLCDDCGTELDLASFYKRTERDDDLVLDPELQDFQRRRGELPF